MSFIGAPSFSASKLPGIIWYNKPISVIYPVNYLVIPSDLSSIPLKAIKHATNNFAQENIIETTYYNWTVYKGELSGKKLAFISIFEQGIDSFALRLLNELTKHQNIVSLIGVCDEDRKKIIVIEHLTRGGLDKHVSSTAHLTWLMRLQISLDIASALHFLQNHPRSWEIDIADLNSASIHLGENWQAKIHCITHRALGYADPSYHTGRQKEIYTFGVILFELLCARPAVTYDEEGGEQFLSKLACSHYEKGTLSEIIDPVLRVQMNRDSFTVFSALAYRCLSEDASKRPTISVVIEQLQKVLKLQQGYEIPGLKQLKSIQHMKIPLEEIRLATRDFTIPRKPGKVYKAYLSLCNVDKYVAENKIRRVSMEEILKYPRIISTVAIKSIDGGYGQRTKERLQTLLYLSHENLVKLVGFCDDDDERIHVVYEHVSDRSLDEYIYNQRMSKRHRTERNMFPWVMRLQFCLEAARGLNFLHNGNRKNRTIVHGNIKSSNILISRDGVGMIGDFGFSTNEHSDTHKLTKEYDVYSFGLVLFEVLSGALTHFKISEDDPKFLPDIVQRGFNQKELDSIIDPMLRQEFEKYRSLIGNRSAESLNMFAKIAYRCFKEEVENRPTMADIVKELEKAYRIHVVSLEQRHEDEDISKLIGSKTISLEEVKSATNHFSKERVIGSGALGKIYKGELSFFNKSIPVAVKRVDRVRCYRKGEFLKDVVKLSRYVHENIITLRGFCEEEYENIIIMDYAINKSLDKHLHKSTLTWGLRLNISIGAAKGLNHIHSFKGVQKTVHGDIKSSNILLDHDWKASISNFIVSKRHGTKGYLHPQHLFSDSTKESDVYSFGVVLFELLSGKLAIEKVEKYSHPTLRQIIDEGHGVKDKKVVLLASLAARCFEDKKLEALIFDDIKEQTDAKSIDILSQVAYECLQKDQEKRPTMALVIQELEKALNIHEEWECEQKLPKDYEEIMKMTEHPEFQVTTKKGLFSLFFSGIRLNNGNVWLSLSEDGKVKEMISATTFSYKNCWSSKLKVLENSRFGTVAKISNTQNLKIPIKIKTKFLSLGIIYGAYLVFKFCDPKMVSSKPYVDLKYKTASGKLNSYIAEQRDGEWMMIELCRFRSHNQTVDFEAQLKSFCGHPCGSGPIFVDGIEFRPIDNVDHEESVDRLINADLSVNWDQQLSSDFQEIMRRSENDVPTTTKEELHKLLSTGVLIDNGEKLFSLSKVNCKKCHMLPAKAVINKSRSPDAKFTKCPSSKMSRFEEVVELQRHQTFSIKCDIEIKMLSPDTAYACYLVFQLPENSEGLKCPVKARDVLNKNNKEDIIIYLRAPGPIDLYRDKRLPKNREDGWMEVRVWEFVYNNEIKDNFIPMELKLVCLGGTMVGLTICGVEFRPLGPCCDSIST